MDLRQIMYVGSQKLKAAGVEEYNITSQRLLMHVLNVDRTWIIINSNSEISKENEDLYLTLINRRKNGEPLEYITNKQYFMDFELEVNNNVLIPRYDTECLVEEVLNFCENKCIKAILDLCTGSGAIAIALASYIKKKSNCEVFASDISDGAVKLAKKNAVNNNLENEIKFFIGNMFEPIDELGKSNFDVIVSNPPYISKGEIETLSKEVKDYEPRIALDGGEDGLDFYRIIAENAPKYLNDNGLLALEIGYDQGTAVSELLKESFINIQVKKDLAGKDRVILAVKG